MKIIINQPRASYFVGGAEMISFEHAINFLKLGHEVTYFTINPISVGLKYSKQYKKFYKMYSQKILFRELDQEQKIKYIYDIIPGEDRVRWNVESIYYNQKLYEYICLKKKKYDLILSYYNLDSVFFLRKYIKYNMLYLCGIPREQNDFQGSFLSAYDIILAITEEVKESWKKYARNDIKVVSTGVDCNRFTNDKKLLVNGNKNKIEILYIGRIIERKNVGMLIDSYEKIKNKYNISLTIVGDGPDLINIKNKSNSVNFIGMVDNPEKYYKNADIFVTPSKYGEGLQGTVLEAMSSGLIIVATKTKINKELLSDGRGFLVEPNVKSISNGIIKAIKADRKRINSDTREYIIKKYSWVEKCKEILESIK